MDILQLLDVVKGENETREGLQREIEIEKEIDTFDDDIVSALVHLDRDDRPEFLGFSQAVVETLSPRLAEFDDPAADQQDAKAVADPSVNVPELVVEFMGDGPRLVGSNGYPFLLKLLLNNRDGIAGAKNGGGQQDDGNRGGDKEHKGPMPDADRP